MRLSQQSSASRAALVKPGRRLMMTVTIVAAILLALGSVGLYGLIRPPAQPAISSPTKTGASVQQSAIGQTNLKTLVHTDDPVSYAKAVANALFTWDTDSVLMPEDYESVVSEDADPSGIETSSLVNDLAAYYPTDAQWQQLRHYKTAETVTVQRAYIPAAWAKALISGPSAVRPGTTAVTIDAVRHRTGSWYGTPASTSDPVSFTVFVACRPTFPRCHILRLSGPDTPLK